jgi:hypothetical protein
VILHEGQAVLLEVVDATHPVGGLAHFAGSSVNLSRLTALVQVATTGASLSG